MFIKFGSLHKKLLIPIIFPIFLKIRKFIRHKKKINSYAYKGFNDFLSLTMFGILFLIMKFKSKSSKDNNKSKNKDKKQELKNMKDIDINEEKYRNKNLPLNDFHSKKKIDNINKKNSKIPKVKQFLFSLLISFSQLTAVFLKYLWLSNKGEEFKYNTQVLFQLIYLIIFSKCFLGFSIYSHQIFSIIIILICLLIFFIESIAYHNEKLTGIIQININYILVQFFYCLSDVLGKKYLITYIDHLYLFLFKIGIIGLIPMITFGIITLFINIDEKYQLFLIFNSTDIWINLLDLFFSFMFQLGLWLTIFYLTPCHYIIYESISNFLEIF